jgi:hypothetical protein
VNEMDAVAEEGVVFCWYGGDGGVPWTWDMRERGEVEVVDCLVVVSWE